jgi:geranylgeranyl reductase family protein
MGDRAQQAQVVVVGAGPGGSTAAYHLAQAGVDVAVLEKSTFPREKVCGDGLTPRAVKQLTALGIETLAADGSAREGWIKNHGLRIIGGGMRIEVPWPDLASFPSYGLVRPRQDFDEILARAAQKAGARLYESTTVTGPLLDERTGRVIGVTTKDGEAFEAPVTLIADGNSSRLSLQLGLSRREDRPMGVAYRRYYRSPRHDDDWLESWLELWDGSRPSDPKKMDGGRLLPGYGWIFGVGDGTSNVGLGILNTSDAFGKTDYRAMLDRWLAHRTTPTARCSSATPAAWSTR